MVSVSKLGASRGLGRWVVLSPWGATVPSLFAWLVPPVVQGWDTLEEHSTSKAPAPVACFAWYPDARDCRTPGVWR